MDRSEPSSMFLHLLQSYFGLLFFFFTICFFVFSLLIFLLRLKFCCDCGICRSFVTTGWSSSFTNLVDWYTHLLAKSKGSTIHIHVLNNTITSNPDNVEYMLKTNFTNYPKGKSFQALLGDLLGRGIFNVDGELWKFQRKMASLELGSVAIRSFAYEIVTSEIRDRLIPLFSSKKECLVDMQDVFRRFAFDSICRFSFGLDPGCLEISLPMSDLAVAFDLSSRLSAERALYLSPVIWKVKRMLNVGSEKKLKQAIGKVNVLAYEVINQRRRLGFENHRDLLSRFMGSIADDTYLRDIVVSFLLAGRDTVASALTSFFTLLSTHPEVEAAILEESVRVMGTGNDTVRFDQLREMPYLQAALYECMRLYPPVQFDSKFAQEDDVLPDGTFVKKGTRVTYHPYAMGRMESIWGTDCLEFKPERWLHDGVFAPESLFKYPVFQGGLRICLGKEMALVEMKCVAVSLIRRFKIDVVEPDQVTRFAPGLTATVQGGLPVRIRERKCLD